MVREVLLQVVVEAVAPQDQAVEEEVVVLRVLEEAVVVAVLLSPVEGAEVVDPLLLPVVEVAAVVPLLL